MMQMVRFAYLGNACGYNLNDKDLSDFKFLFFNNPRFGQAILSRTVCVKSCPTDLNQPLDCFPTGNVTSCDLLKSYDTTVFADGFCLPTEKEVLAKIASLFSGLNIESCVESIYMNRYIILGSVVFAFMLSYFFSFFLQHCTWCVVIISMVGVYALGIYISIASWSRYRSLKSEPSTSESESEVLSNANFYKWVAIALWGALSLLLLITVCLFSRIKLAVNVIKAAAEFVSDQKGIVILPLVMILLNAAFLAYWLWSLAAIFSTGEIYHSYDYPWGKIKYNDSLK